jgi:signal transduction histidine kinase
MGQVESRRLAGKDAGVASLLVIEGADQGRRFELPPRASSVGRDSTNPIRLHDNEVSRRHAELRPSVDDAFRVVDLGSANGTFVNERPVDQAPLRGGDRLRVGRTVLLYQEGAQAGRDLTQRVDLLGKASLEDRSAIIRSIPADEGSRLLDAPGSAGEWLKVRLANLGVMYQATQAISHIVDTEVLLPRILQLVFESINADRAAILLADEESGGLVPKVVRWRGESEPDERMAISQTIVEHVRETGQGVITTDAPADTRFSPGQSIVDFGIREAICVPVEGRHTRLGVLYADLRAGLALPDETVPGAGAAPAPAPGAAPVSPSPSAPGSVRGRLTNEHLTLMAAIGHQAGLAIENTRFYEAKLQAERLAAVGQTIATLSHHIKNILQGLRGGSYLIDMGLKDTNEEVIRRGWSIVEKNQTKIYNLVMDMLSFSKEREPALEEADLNATVADVVELMQSRAHELAVALTWEPAPVLPAILIDPEGVHRATLNLVTNALDATQAVAGGGRVRVRTSWDEAQATARVIVSDNGAGIAEEDLDGVFQLFASSKGTRGTGLGLPVSRKIVREHGGEIRVASPPPGEPTGTAFTIELPQRRAEGTLA